MIFSFKSQENHYTESDLFVFAAKKMKHNGFEIKISDMLTSKVSDRIEFENKMLEELPNLTAEGVSGQITLQSLTKDAIFAKIENLTCQLEENCERCGANYQREIQVQDYTAKFVLNINEDEQKEEEVLPIDAKNGVIDLGELIYHAIKMQEPFIKRCPACESELATEAGDDTDRDSEREEEL